MTSGVPTGWRTIRLDEVLEFKNGLNKEKRFFGRGTPIVNFMDVLNHTTLTSEHIRGRVTLDRDEIKRFSALLGDVFFTRTSESVTEIGTSSVLVDAIPDAVFSGFVLRGRPRTNDFDTVFMGYALQAAPIRDQIISTATYTTRALTNGGSLGRVRLVVPEIAEQRAIAEALSDVDALVVAAEGMIAKKQLIKQGMMQELLTGRTRLPGFNEPWREARLGDVAKIRTGSRNNQDKTSSGQYPFFVRSATVEQIDSYSYDCEAILIPGEGGIGSIFHYIVGKFEVHQRVYKISHFETDICGKFVYFHIRQFFGRHAMANSVKAAVDSLRLSTFNDFSMNIPGDFEEQRAIAGVLGDATQEIETLRDRLTKTKAVKQGMMQELLTGRTRLRLEAAQHE